MGVDKTELGYCEGDLCNRDGCDGIISQSSKEGGCSCHISPPCSYCVNMDQYCNECGWSNEDDIRKEAELQKNKPKSKEVFTFVEKQYDETPIYQVCRYFDDHFEAVVKSNLTEKEAYDEKYKRNSGQRCYVSYEIRKMN